MKSATVMGSHESFWLSFGIILVSLLIVALIARRADHPIAIENQSFGDGAPYRWLKFHRVAL